MNNMESLSYNACTKRWPTKVAASPADLGRRIESVDGPDQAKRGLFAKNPSYLSEINPQSYFLSQFIFQKKTSTFTKINPQSVPSYGLIFCLAGPACLEWAKNGP